MSVQGRTALVTGGSRGIGSAIAKRLAADGATVAITYAGNKAAAGATVAAIESAGGIAFAFQADAADPASQRSGVEQAAGALGGIDILVHNAGVAEFSTIAEDTDETYDRQFGVNVKGLHVGTRLVYDAAHYLLVSVDLPLVGHVIDASPDRPYLCCKIDLDPAMLSDLMVAEGGAVPHTDLPVLGVYPSDPDLIDAACRLVGLLDRPDTIRVLAPLIEREILYRLLTGPHGPMLRHLVTAGSHLNQISRAIAAIRRRFDAPIRIDEVAAMRISRRSRA